VGLFTVCPTCAGLSLGNIIPVTGIEVMIVALANYQLLFLGLSLSMLFRATMPSLDVFSICSTAVAELVQYDVRSQSGSLRNDYHSEMWPHSAHLIMRRLSIFMVLSGIWIFPISQVDLPHFSQSVGLNLSLTIALICSSLRAEVTRVPSSA